MLEAIKVTRQNLSIMPSYILDKAPWAADFKTIFETNLANGEWTYVIAKTRQTGLGPKTFYSHMSEKKFNETFEFTAPENPFALAPITQK